MGRLRAIGHPVSQHPRAACGHWGDGRRNPLGEDPRASADNRASVGASGGNKKSEPERTYREPFSTLCVRSSPGERGARLKPAMDFALYPNTLSMWLKLTNMLVVAAPVVEQEQEREREQEQEQEQPQA